MTTRLSSGKRRSTAVMGRCLIMAAALGLLLALMGLAPALLPLGNQLPMASDAHAQDYVEPQIEVSPDMGPPGTKVTIEGSGFWSGCEGDWGTVNVSFDEVVFANVCPDWGGEGQGGVFSVDYTIPPGTTDGEHGFKAEQLYEGPLATAVFQVTAPADGESMATPRPPDGPSLGEVNDSLTFSWGYTLSSAGHPGRIRLDWGDGTTSDWLDAGAQDPRTASHMWDHEGTYLVKARARCTWHPDIISAWSAAKKVTISPVDERVTTPSAPTGPSTGEEEESLLFSTGDASSNLGHALEYRFDWGDKTSLEWASSTTGSHSWSKADTYTIKAQARCAEHTDKVSEWSDGTDVIIVVPEERISTPTAPSGPSAGGAGGSLTYSTGGATSNLGHIVVYRFDWGDDTFSEWSSSGTDSYAWSEQGTYNIRAQARCAWHHDRVSEWSGATTVVIGPPGGETVGKPRPPAGPPDGDVDQETTFSTGDASCSLGHSVEYRFDWGDTESSEWSSSSSASHSWAEEGTYALRAQARCAVNTGIVSAWSDVKSIAVTLPFVVTDLEITPDEVDPGETVTVAVQVSNGGVAERSQPVELVIDGEVVAVEEVTLQGGTSTTAYFTVSRDATGLYGVTVGDNDGEFTVRASVAWSVVGGTIAGLIVLALIILLIRRLLKSV